MKKIRRSVFCNGRSYAIVDGGILLGRGGFKLEMARVHLPTAACVGGAWYRAAVTSPLSPLYRIVDCDGPQAPSAHGWTLQRTQGGFHQMVRGIRHADGAKINPLTEDVNFAISAEEQCRYTEWIEDNTGVREAPRPMLAAALMPDCATDYIDAWHTAIIIYKSYPELHGLNQRKGKENVKVKA